jgi:proteic killer suppression protein
MIKGWKHKGLKRFYEKGDQSGIQPEHAHKLKVILQLLDAATEPQDLNLPGMNLHPLKGKMKGYYAVKVSGNWRVIFQFEGRHAVAVNYVDYH